ncbi:MAG: hypothetical protein HKN18_13560 [Silicimonas sp.]|nr:hypothetical protein [Silicimonas sp.]
MSVRSVFLWCIAAFLGLSVLMMLSPAEAPVATLQYGLGPTVETDPL